MHARKELRRPGWNQGGAGRLSLTGNSHPLIAADSPGQDRPADHLARARFDRRVSLVHRLVPRPVAEFVREIVVRLAGDDPERLAWVDARLDAYAKLDGGVVRALGTDRLPPVPLSVIVGGAP